MNHTIGADAVHGVELEMISKVQCDAMAVIVVNIWAGLVLGFTSFLVTKTWKVKPIWSALNSPFTQHRYDQRLASGILLLVETGAQLCNVTLFLLTPTQRVFESERMFYMSDCIVDSRKDFLKSSAFLDLPHCQKVMPTAVVFRPFLNSGHLLGAPYRLLCKVGCGHRDINHLRCENSLTAPVPLN